MKKIVHFELKKFFNKKFFLVMIGLLVLNVFNIMFTHLPAKTSQFYQGKLKIIDQVAGVITQEKIDFLVAGINRNTTLVESGSYDSKQGDDGTYTGYVYGDMNAFTEVYHELKERYLYQEDITKKLIILNENIERSGHENDYSRLIKKQLENRYIHTYYDTSGIQQYLDYTDSILFIIVVIIFKMTHYLYYDQRFAMEPLVFVTKHGRTTVKKVKWLLTTFSTVTVAMIFFITDFISFSLIYPMDGLFEPIYSVQTFAMTFFNCSIGSYIGLLLIIKLLSLLFLGQLILLAQRKIKNSYLTTVLSLLVSILIWYLLFSSNTQYTITILGKSFAVHQVFGRYIHDDILLVIIFSIFILAISGVYLYKGRYKYDKA